MLEGNEAIELCALGYVLSGVRPDLHPLAPDLFTTPKARKIAETLVKFSDGTMLTAMDNLTPEDYKAVGGMEGLQEIEASWRLYGVEGAAEVVRTLEERREDRRINSVCLQIMERVRSKQGFDDLQQQLTRRTAKADYTPLLGAVHQGLKRLDDIRTGKVKPTPLAIVNLDSEYSLWPGHLVIWAARVKQGKTAGALQLAYRLTTMGHPVCFYSLEMPSYQLGLRVLSQVSGVARKFYEMEKLSDRQSQSLVDVLDKFKRQDNLFRLVSGVTYDEQIYAHIRAQAQEGVRVFFIDYLGLVTPTKREATQEREIANFTKSLKRLAVELDAVIVVLAQINRENVKGATKTSGPDKHAGLRPQIHHIKGSGAIEADSDLIILQWLYPDEYGLSTDTGEIIIGANRHGGTGVYPVRFHGTVLRFERL